MGKYPGTKSSFFIFFPIADCPGKARAFYRFIFFYNSVGCCTPTTATLQHDWSFSAEWRCMGALLSLWVCHSAIKQIQKPQRSAETETPMWKYWKINQMQTTVGKTFQRAFGRKPQMLQRTSKLRDKEPQTLGDTCRQARGNWVTSRLRFFCQRKWMKMKHCCLQGSLRVWSWSCSSCLRDLRSWRTKLKTSCSTPQRKTCKPM